MSHPPFPGKDVQAVLQHVESIQTQAMMLQPCSWYKSSQPLHQKHETACCPDPAWCCPQDFDERWPRNGHLAADLHDVFSEMHTFAHCISSQHCFCHIPQAPSSPGPSPPGGLAAGGAAAGRRTRRPRPTGPRSSAERRRAASAAALRRHRCGAPRRRRAPSPHMSVVTVF